MEWRNIYRGLLMGASDVVPGVSGGTIAVVLGIYDRLIEAINGFFSKEYKKHLMFLIPLGIGILTAIFLLAGVIEWLFEHYPKQTQFAFLGLIIGVLPFLLQKSEAKRTFKPKHIFMTFLGICLVGSMIFFQTGEPEPVIDFTMSTYLWLFGSGFIASSAMILPGISGSFLLYVIGSYTTIISAIKNLDIMIILIVGIGIFLGILIMSKVIHYFLETFPTATYAVVIGMVIGSVFVIFPGFPTNISGTVVCVISFAGGLLFAYLLGRVEYR
ncbi:membrane protein [Gracilibacillus boraciitolerans JCM 21714]|uniref:Membrane protein n=1 Tax=Gracilibacillus boraciitolerans JCM 21714 TaxID=1298598 RepID=W4VK67_9BACI|nr:DUF368 domain-containing protein [Gracilibacillus boraciitolerans]GAE93536.1 membrane protein [Gracilibacillus boraciitolerans JCM 21714]